MLLTLADQSPFATGATGYSYDSGTGGGGSIKVVLDVIVDELPTAAILDTGAPFLVCSPLLAQALQPEASTALGATVMMIRGYLVRGNLHRFTLTMLAELGDDLTLEVTAFVPNAGQLAETVPTFLGMQGCLERMRFALDPMSDTFYFGPLA